MASIARPTILRQCHKVAAATRSFCIASPRPAHPHEMSKSLVRSQIKLQFIRPPMPGAAKIAAFHASSRKSILPPLPQTIDGTTNDPVPVPDASPSHGSYHWTAERLVAASIVPLTLVPFAAGSLNPVTDAIFGALLVAHSHIGFQACITDYFPRKRVPVLRKSLDWTLNIATVLVLIGVYEFETNDVGITEAVARVWKA